MFSKCSGYCWYLTQALLTCQSTRPQMLGCQLITDTSPLLQTEIPSTGRLAHPSPTPGDKPQPRAQAYKKLVFLDSR